MSDNTPMSDDNIKASYKAYHEALERVKLSDMPDKEDEDLIAMYEVLQVAKKALANTSFQLDIAESRLFYLNKEKKL